MKKKKKRRRMADLMANWKIEPQQEYPGGEAEVIESIREELGLQFHSLLSLRCRGDLTFWDF